MTARTRRARWPWSSTATSAPSSSSRARPTSRPSPTTSPRWSRTWPSWCWPRAPTRCPSGPTELEDLKIAKKENIELGHGRALRGRPTATCSTPTSTSRTAAASTPCWSSWPAGRRELAHDVAVHIAFAKPPYLTRDEVPADAVEKERQALLDITKAEGKPEQAWPKIVEGRLNAWYKDQVLLEQGFVRDDKTSITQLLGDATSCASPRSTSARDRAAGPRRPWLASQSPPRPRRRGARPAGVGCCSSSRARPSPARASTASTARSSSGWPAQIVEVRQRPRHRRGHRGRRRQHLARDVRCRRRHGPGPGRLHGDAGHRHQRLGAPGHPRAARPAHPGADRHPDGAGGRALHPPSGHPPPGEGSGRHLRRRHRQPLLHHRHHRRAARRRDRGGRAAQGHAFGDRRHLHRRSAGPTPRPPGSTR